MAILTAFVFTALTVQSSAAPPTTSAMVAVAEMERPDGIRADRNSRIRELARDANGQRGVVALRDYLTRNWANVRALDVVGMSRYHVDSTRGWQVPAEAGKLSGRVIGADDGGAYFVEIVGPRLPARYAIVYRHLTFSARYQPATGTLDRVTATIRIEVQE
ncbi:MAG: hypothetical protein AAF610_07355 [Pseudomonadota bacterium]